MSFELGPMREWQQRMSSRGVHSSCQGGSARCVDWAILLSMVDRCWMYFGIGLFVRLVRGADRTVLVRLERKSMLLLW